MNRPADSVIARLEQVIRDRQIHFRADSYTCQLFSAGTRAVADKVLEEAGEACEAALVTDSRERRSQVTREAADLVYHLLVLLAGAGVAWRDVEGELQRRFGVSGLEEKARRGGRQ